MKEGERKQSYLIFSVKKYEELISNGQNFKIGQTFKGKKDARALIANYSVKERRDLHYFQGSLTPTAKEIIEESKKHASQLRCVFNGSEKYQVTGELMDQYAVNLRERTCTCRNWDITGIPCKHAIAAILWISEDWVNKCYWLSTWIEQYQYKVDPVNGRNMWPRAACPTAILPPKPHKQVGRPKKKRKRAADEPSQSKSLSRKYLTVTCTKCHNKGHNSRTCKGQGGPSEVGKGNGKKNGKGGPSEVERGNGKKNGKAPAL